MERVNPGLCRNCRFAQRQKSRRGAEFVRCRRADHDEHFVRYPDLPVYACKGYESSAGPRGPSDPIGSPSAAKEES